jgi:branched-chain amino acid transport system substrate-binding protein
MKRNSLARQRQHKVVLVMSVCALVVPLAACGTRVPIASITSAERGNLAPGAAVTNGGTADGAGSVAGTTSGTGTAGSSGGATVSSGAATGGGAVSSSGGGGTTASGGGAVSSSGGSKTASGGGAVSSSGGSKTESGGATKTQTGSTATPCTSSDNTTPIVIGQTGAFSGIIGAAVGGEKLGLALWADEVNAAGGIQCHPVKLYQEDDGSNPSQAAANADDLINNKHAVALVDTDEPLSLDAVRSVSDKDRIPIVGGDLFGAAWNTDPLLFEQGTSALSTFAVGLQAAAKSIHAKKAGVLYCVEAAICTLLGQNFKNIAHVAGVTSVYSQSMSITQTSFTSDCQNAKAAGVQVLFLGMEGASETRIATSCSSIGYHPVIATVGLAIPASLESNALLQQDTVFLGSAVVPFDETALPAQREFDSDVKQYAAGQGVDQNTFQGWVAGQLFAAGLNALGASLRTKAVTTADVEKGLYNLPKNDTLGGVSPPLNFTPGKPGPRIACGFLLALTKGGFHPEFGNERFGVCA